MQTVKPRKKERKNTIIEEKEKNPTLKQKTAPMGAIKCIKRLKTNKSSANRRSCPEAAYFALLLTRCAIEIVCSVWLIELGVLKS